MRKMNIKELCDDLITLATLGFIFPVNRDGEVIYLSDNRQMKPGDQILTLDEVIEDHERFLEEQQNEIHCIDQ